MDPLPKPNPQPSPEPYVTRSHNPYPNSSTDLTYFLPSFFVRFTTRINAILSQSNATISGHI